MKIHLNGEEIALACAEFVCRRDFGGRPITMKVFSMSTRGDPNVSERNVHTGEIGVKGEIQAIIEVEEMKERDKLHGDGDQR